MNYPAPRMNLLYSYFAGANIYLIYLVYIPKSATCDIATKKLIQCEANQMWLVSLGDCDSAV